MVTKLPPGSFFGRTERQQRVGEIVVLDSIYCSDPTIPPHEHASSFFDFVIEGDREEFESYKTMRGPAA
jgi:AraC family transcriptional regulator